MSSWPGQTPSPAPRYCPAGGAKSAATVLARYSHLRSIPAGADDCDVVVPGGSKLARTLRDQYADCLLFRRIATLEYGPPSNR